MSVLDRLTPRERVLVLGGGVLVAALVVWSVVWTPLVAANARLTSEIAGYAQVRAAVRGGVAAPVALRRDPVARGPVATRITRTADATGLPVVRLEPEAAGIAVTVGEVDFAVLLAWLSALETTEALGVAGIEIDRRTAPGQITARVVLEEMP